MRTVGQILSEKYDELNELFDTAESKEEIEEIKKARIAIADAIARLD